RSAVSIVLVYLEALALRLSSCASSSVPVSGEAPNIWVTRSTDSTSSWAKVRTCDAPDSSAENKRVTDSFMLGHFTHLRLTSRRVNFVVVHWDRHHQGDPDAKRLHTALVLWRCAAV